VGGPHSKKRYLILTYAVEFDRVHYPLPLAFEAIPSADSMQRTISRLRRELVEQRAAAAGAGAGSGDSRVEVSPPQRRPPAGPGAGKAAA